MTFHLKDLDLVTLHHLAREARARMTPDEINHAAKVARANMRLVARQKELFRLQCRDEGIGDNWQTLGDVTARVIKFRGDR